MRRREFIKTAALAGGCAALGGCRSFGGSGIDRVPYGDTIGDRLWMWGHHAMSFASMKGAKEGYNLPYDRRIDMADACRDMGIPGCFVVRWRNLPVHADVPEYMKQFKDMRRVGFSITDSAPESFADKVRLGYIINETRYPIPSTLPSIRRSTNPAHFACTSAMFIIRRQNEAKRQSESKPADTPAETPKAKERKKPVQLTLFDL